MEKQPLLNTYVNNVDMREAVEAIEEMIVSDRKGYVVPVNVDMVVKMETDQHLKEIIDRADMAVVDGKPLVWISKWHGRPVKAKVSGSDLVPLLCRRAAEKGYSYLSLAAWRERPGRQGPTWKRLFRKSV